MEERDRDAETERFTVEAGWHEFTGTWNPHDGYSNFAIRRIAEPVVPWQEPQ